MPNFLDGVHINVRKNTNISSVFVDASPTLCPICAGSFRVSLFIDLGFP